MGWSNVVDWLHVVVSGALVGTHLLFTFLVWMPFPARGDGSAFQLWRRVENVCRRFAVAAFALGLVSGGLLLRITLISPDLYRTTPYGRILEIKVGCVLLYGFAVTLMPRAHALRDGRSSPLARRLSLLALLALLAASLLGHYLPYA